MLEDDIICSLPETETEDAYYSLEVTGRISQFANEHVGSAELTIASPCQTDHALAE